MGEHRTRNDARRSGPGLVIGAGLADAMTMSWRRHSRASGRLPDTLNTHRVWEESHGPAPLVYWETSHRRVRNTARLGAGC